MSDALVLSGGGSRGDFEVGALQYLYEGGYFASTVCTTSVGSVNGVQLARGGDSVTQKAAFLMLKSVWQTQMRFNSDLYDEAPWLAGVSAATRAAVVSLFPGRMNVPSLLADATFFPPLLFGQVARAGIDLGSALAGLGSAQSVFTLDPIRAKLTAVLDAGEVAASGVTLRLVTVSLDSGHVRYVTQDGHVMNVDGSLVPGIDSTLCEAERRDADAARQAVADAHSALSEAHGTSAQAKARSDIVRADAALARARSALGTCERAHPVRGLTVTLIDGVIASAAIPCVFPPVTLGNESYVDGGVRWILPLEAALVSSASRVVAINASPAGVPPTATVFATASMLDIAERTVADILLWETQERQLEVAKLKSAEQSKQVWVVTPRVSVHDLLTIDPGLIDMHISYGYMCAADVLTSFGPVLGPITINPGPGPSPIGPGAPPRGPFHGAVPVTVPPTKAGWVDGPTDPRAAALADAITACRYRCWEVEHDVFGAARTEQPFAIDTGVVRVPDPGALDDLRLLKTLVGLIVLARQNINVPVPADYPMWADAWERHSWDAGDFPGPGSTPWNAFVSAAGNRAATVRPTVLIVRLADRPEVYLLNAVKSWVRSAAGLKGLDPRGFAAVQIIPNEVRQILDAFPSAPDIP